MLRTRRTSRLVALPLALGSASLLAACGGSASDGAGAAGTDGKGAAATPASAVFFVDGNTDTSSDGWKKATALGARFPGWPELVGKVDEALAKTEDGMSFNADVRPWLGGETSFAVTGVKVAGAASDDGPQVDWVAYVESKDDDKLKAALAKSADELRRSGSYAGYDLWAGTGTDEALRVAVGDGALLAASSEAGVRSAVDLREGKGESLADSDLYKDTLAKLPDDNLFVGFVDAAKARQLSQLAQGVAAPASGAAGVGALAGIEKLNDELLKGYRSFGFSFGAEDGGARMRMVSLLAEGDERPLGVTENFKPALTATAPSGSLVYVGFRDLGPMLQRALDVFAASEPEVGRQLGQLEAATGVSFTGDLVPLLSGEHAIYAGVGQPVAAALLLRPDDAAKGAATLKKLTNAATRQQSGLQFTPVPNGEGEQITQGGQTFGWRKVDDVLAIGNDPKGGEDQGGGLAGSDKYTALAEKAGTPDELNGLLYLDVPGLVTLGEAAEEGESRSPSDQKAIDNLKHLGGVLAWSVLDGDASTSDLFVEVR
ncbi:MAG: hypothetical protein AVDCRST_MAG79-959 [uncultured Thermoleophilia bacterium]|uniref:DUF3352 domain-containing protein n=1 Tax=uncultured Thermoleophilia bacterium TaxID=1497501 RepID=A0A6J4TSS4_9ACTN|nr:MAG: hypothetical protein AVDCRST_MAG79-959 [uncultured Thermoleophilia bacterium]